MRRTLPRLAATLTLALLAALPVRAADLALVIANSRYATLPQVEGAEAAQEAARLLHEQGFEVVQVVDANSRALARALDRFHAAQARRAAPDAAPSRLAVVLLGQFAASTQDLYLLPVDSPAAPTLVQAAREGLALSLLWPVLERYPGRAAVLLGLADASEDAAEAPPAASLLALSPQALPAPLASAPNGTTLIVGPSARIGWFAQNALSREGLNLREGLAKVPELQASGFLPADLVFLPAPVEDDTPPPPAPDPETEEVFWKASRSADTLAAYEAYLRRFPNGTHAAEARKLAEEIRTEPDRPARLAEEALGLDRAQRRELQEALQLLGHDPRGVDGIFGAGSRAAIRAWQVSEGEPANGYLTRAQIARLLEQGRARKAEVEAEEAAKRQAAEREDRAWWEATGAVGDEAGLRSYLDRYPEGLFAPLARERLAAIEAQARAQAEAAERRDWERARRADTAEAYRAHLTRWPEGIHAEQARRRLAELEAPPGPEPSDDGAADDAPGPAGNEAEARARAAEAALDIGRAGRLLVEQRLADLGLAPGPVDGVFDASTRRALTVWQEGQGLPATGYLDQASLMRLLAGQLLNP